MLVVLVATASGATSVEATNTVGGTIGGVSSKTSPDTVSEVISVKTTARGNTGTSSLTMATATSGALDASPDSQNFSESDLEKSPATVLEAKPNRKRYLTRSIGDARPFFLSISARNVPMHVVLSWHMFCTFQLRMICAYSPYGDYSHCKLYLHCQRY